MLIRLVPIVELSDLACAGADLYLWGPEIASLFENSFDYIGNTISINIRTIIRILCVHKISSKFVYVLFERQTINSIVSSKSSSRSMSYSILNKVNRERRSWFIVVLNLFFMIVILDNDLSPLQLDTIISMWWPQASALFPLPLIQPCVCTIFYISCQRWEQVKIESITHFCLVKQCKRKINLCFVVFEIRSVFFF